MILFRDFPSLSRDFCSSPCPGTKGQQDKDFHFVPGQGDIGSSRPRLYRDCCVLLETLPEALCLSIFGIVSRTYGYFQVFCLFVCFCNICLHILSSLEYLDAINFKTKILGADWLGDCRLWIRIHYSFKNYFTPF